MFTQQKFNKAQALETFKQNELPFIREIEKQNGNGVDSCMRTEAWNNYTDMLCKGGQITQSQYNRWASPF